MPMTAQAKNAAKQALLDYATAKGGPEGGRQHTITVHEDTLHCDFDSPGLWDFSCEGMWETEGPGKRLSLSPLVFSITVQHIEGKFLSEVEHEFEEG